MAVSKQVSPESITQLYEAGHRDFGENRADEAVEKHAATSGLDIRWHFVGRLQRNKVKEIAAFVDVVHSLDRPALAAEMARRWSKPVDVLVEVNLTDDPSRGGVSPDSSIPVIEAALASEVLVPVGLMAMAPVVGTPEQAREYFVRLRKLRHELAVAMPGAGIRHLSMGMSQDYEVAVEEGATMVRIGEAIFGPRRGVWGR